VEYYDGVVNPTSSNEANMWLKLVASTNKYVAMRYLCADLLETSPGGTYSGNFHLTTAQMTANAEYIYWYLSQRGWIKSAVCGLLGNWQKESEINPGAWENWSSTHTSANSYGLAQWDDSTKITWWAPAHGYTTDSLIGQVERILAEGKGIAPPEQEWFDAPGYPVSFAQYKASTSTADYLAKVFCKNYERPKSQTTASLNERGDLATAWYAVLN
jgi:hypothetical protein